MQTDNIHPATPLEVQPLRASTRAAVQAAGAKCIDCGQAAVTHFDNRITGWAVKSNTGPAAFVPIKDIVLCGACAKWRVIAELQLRGAIAKHSLSIC